MVLSSLKIRSLIPFIFPSVFVHVICCYLMAESGPMAMGPPLQPLTALSVTLAPHAEKQTLVEAGAKGGVQAARDTSPSAIEEVGGETAAGSAATQTRGGGDASPVEDTPFVASGVGSEKETEYTITEGPMGKAVATGEGVEKLKLPAGDLSHHFAVDYGSMKGPVHTAREFDRTGRERLTYRLSMLGVAVGSAVMEAASMGSEFRVTLRILSNNVLSTLYPVDTLVETRMVNGNYLLTRVRQREGSFRGDIGFTLLLREHKAFWVDRMTGRYDYQPIPGDDVLDVLSGFYFLRNMDLEVGRDVALNIFDSNEVSPTIVEVLRRERVAISGHGEIDTLVLHPRINTAGFFRRSGDINVWVSDDVNRVPVRMETFITMGKVTAELIASEIEAM